MEPTHAFPIPGDPSFVVAAGWIYYQVCMCPQDNIAVHWMLCDGLKFCSSLTIPTCETFHYCGFEPYRPPSPGTIPLHQVFNLYKISNSNTPSNSVLCPLSSDSSCDEITTVMYYENTLCSTIIPWSFLIPTANNHTWSISVVSRLWEPMAYPLFPSWHLWMVSVTFFCMRSIDNHAQ